ncbi:hypothetical protein [Marinifilum caeruleilacunae]|uniref:DUF5673 domain-containing protein n=1 Tax=Marinifilum caeruleilacunae TaxID=2499076 RepID=A0ABX1WTQ5_9BACT|nr:hypothetical protein [Marinifilum caeruleilacunae]NOU59392.1 hypothetical protein [Marinifilum caeruleilacunae]
MLQFEFDIRDHKINNNEARGKQLALAIAFLISAVLLYVFNRYFNFLPHGNYLIFALSVVALYFVGLLLGCKFLYPKEYLTINSRKLTYKTGWYSKELKVYLKDINEIRIRKHKMILKLKNKEDLILKLEHFNDQSILVLKNYLNIEE